MYHEGLDVKCTIERRRRHSSFSFGRESATSPLTEHPQKLRSKEWKENRRNRLSKRNWCGIRLFAHIKHSQLRKRKQQQSARKIVERRSKQTKEEESERERKSKYVQHDKSETCTTYIFIWYARFSETKENLNNTQKRMECEPADGLARTRKPLV